MFTIRLHLTDYVLRMFGMQGKKFLEQNHLSLRHLELAPQFLGARFGLGEELAVVRGHVGGN